MKHAFIAGSALLFLVGLPPALAQSPAKGGAQAADLPNWRAAPRYTTLNLRAGFEPDPREVPVEAGGLREALAVRPDCAGWIDFTRPDVDLNYEPGQYPLFISATSSADTTIVINDPAGTWHCNDDLVGLDPGVVFQRPLRGNYNIWIGTLDRGAPQRATVRVSEVPPGGTGGQAAPGASSPSTSGQAQSPVARQPDPLPPAPGNNVDGADTGRKFPPAPLTNSLASGERPAGPALGPVVGRAERIIVTPVVAQVGQRLNVTLQNFPQPNNDMLMVVPAGTPDAEASQGGRVLFQQSIYNAPTQPIEIGPFAPGQYEVRYLTTLYNNERRREVSARTAFSVQ